MTIRPQNTPAPLKTIAVFGNGLAGQFCVAKLARDLPDGIDLIYVEAEKSANEDIFYGTVTSPSSYDFLLSLGITEPDLLPQTNTAFSLGTQFMNWGHEKAQWIQSFHRPLPIFNGVGFQHYLTRLRTSAPEMADINAYIISVQSAMKGVFAHPPEGQKTPLAEMEYGYQFLPSAWHAFLAQKLQNSRVKCVTADVTSVDRDGDDIRLVTLSDGTNVKAGVFIDCLGPASKLKSEKTVQTAGRHLKAISRHTSTGKLGAVCRTLTGTDFGWTAETPLQDGLHCLTVFDPSSEPDAMADHGPSETAPVEMEIGYVATPWVGNCLTLGLGAAALEPLTPAPMMLLERDIDRLTELIPVDQNMKIEAREYNRRFSDDYGHADIFHRALFPLSSNTQAPYQTAACAAPIPQNLSDKIEQFQSRGVLIQYDYEPFSRNDWAMLHLGMGRNPQRYDPLADRVSESQLKTKLTQMSGAIDAMTAKMPPHHIYMSGLLRYLKEQHG